MNSTCFSYRAPLSFSFNDCSACLIDGFDRNPLLYSSSFSCNPCYCSCCCCCCAKSVSFSSCCNGLRQYNLIQWSPRKRLILNNVDRFSYRRRLLSENDYVFRERKVGNGRFRRMVFEEMSDWDGSSASSSDGGLDEVEAILSLLAEVSGEYKNVGGTHARQSCRKIEVVERGSSSDRRRKKNVDSGVLESRVEIEYESKVMGSKGEGLRWKEDCRRRKGRIEDERSKPRRKDSSELVKEEKRMNLFVDDRRERSSREERESLSAREDHKQKLGKDGSGGSSYYSASSADYEYDDENDDEIQHDQGAFEEEMSGGYLRDSGKSERIVSDEVKDEMRGKETREQDVVLRKETAKAGFSGASSSVAYDWRKKSEKKLSDSSVQEIKANEELVQKQFRLGKTVNVDEKRTKERNDQMILRERRMKSEQSNEILESHATDVKTYSTTGKIYKGDSFKSQSSVQKESKYRIGHNQIHNEKDCWRSSGKSTEASKLQEVENRVTSTAVRQSGIHIKSEQDHSNTTLSTLTNIEEKRHQSSQASGLLDSNRKYQQLTEELDSGSSSILKRQSDSRMEKHEINSSSSYKSQYNLRKEETSFASHETIGVSIAPYSNTILSSVDAGRTRTGMVMEPPPQVAVGGPIRVKLIEEVAGERVYGSMTSSDKHTLDRSEGFHYQSSDDARRDDGSQPSKYVSSEDRLASADLLQKSSLQHVGEFVEKAKKEISSSELPEVKETQEIKSAHEDEQRSKANLSSHSSQVSQSKERNSRSSSRGSASKGPSDQIWDVSEPSVQEPPEAEALGNESTTDKVEVKRTGKSVWNIIGDIVRLRWHSHSETNSSGAKSGGKNSPIQSTSDETWFSGRDHEENIEPNTKSGRISPVEKSTSTDQRQEGKVSSGSEGEVSNSSNSPGNRKQKRAISFPSSSAGVSEKYSAIKLLPSQFGEATSDVKESSVVLPSLELKMSPVEKAPKATEGEGSSSGTGSQTKIPILTAEKPAFGGKSEKSKRKKLGRSDQFEKDRFDEWEEAYRLESDQRRIDETFMREALLEAKKAADSWEVPVGAVLVKDGKIIARGYNLVEELRDSTAHAEINCIREASNVLRTWRLSDTTLYVTLEPCPMCAGAIFQARIDAVVWGAPNKLLGADGSWIRLFPNGEGGNDIEPSNKPAAPVHPFHPNITVRRRVLESECADAMQQFFRLRRKKDKSPEPTTPPSGHHVSHHPSKFLSKMHHAFHILFCL